MRASTGYIPIMRTSPNNRVEAIHWMDVAAIVCGGMALLALALGDWQQLWVAALGGVLMGVFGGWFAAYVRQFKKTDIGALGICAFLVIGLILVGWEQVEVVTKRMRMVVYNGAYIAVAFTLARGLLKRWAGKGGGELN